MSILSALKKRLRGSSRKGNNTRAPYDANPPHSAVAPVTPLQAGLKPKWHEPIDRAMLVCELPPDDAVPHIRSLFLEDLGAPHLDRREQIDAEFQWLVGAFAHLDTKYVLLRPSLPANPLELKFYEKENDRGPNRYQ